MICLPLSYFLIGIIYNGNQCINRDVKVKIMVKINLATYNIYAYSKEHNEKIKLDNLNKGTLLHESNEFNHFKQILSLLFLEHSFTFEKKFLRVKQFDNIDEKIFFGELEFGSFGTKHAVVNAERDDMTERIINPDESVLTPYYFFIQLFSIEKMPY